MRIVAAAVLALAALLSSTGGAGAYWYRGGGGVVEHVDNQRQLHRHHLHDRVDVRLAGLPAPLVAKVHEIIDHCRGFHVVSAYRPGARIAGSGRISLHALHRAADIAGPHYACAYARLHGWPGGVSIDAYRMHHIHLSWAPHSREWHARFRHGGGTRYAARYRHPVVILWHREYWPAH
jgi:hypothetical protein